MVFELIATGAALVVFLGFGFKLNNTIGRFKKEMSDKYTRKDVCNIIHLNLNDDMKEIKSDIKTLLRLNGKRG